MIRRPAGKDFLLIAQHDHALFAGFLAGHLGNDLFAAPVPREEVVAATAFHDAGWPLHDDAAQLNSAGQPLHVFEIPMSLATKIWSASASRALAHGPYTALLVSLHQLALSTVARKMDDPQPHERAQSQRDQFELNKFQHQQIELQDTLRKQLGMRTDLPLHLGLAAAGSGAAEDQLRFNFRLLTLCDRLSLQLCCAKPLFPAIDDAIPRPGTAPITLQTRWIDDTTTAIEPWPFNEAKLSAEVPFRRVSAEGFGSEETFRAAFHAAPVEALELSLCAHRSGSTLSTSR